jgi:hypothetical protein
MPKQRTPVSGAVTPADELCELITHLSGVIQSYEMTRAAVVHAAEQYHVDPVVIAACQERGRRAGYRAVATIGHEQLLAEQTNILTGGNP